MKYFARAAKNVHEKYPDVNLILQNGTSSETIELLKSKKGDIGFVNLPIDDSEISLMNTVMRLHDTFVASERFSELTATGLESLSSCPRRFYAT